MITMFWQMFCWEYLHKNLWRREGNEVVTLTISVWYRTWDKDTPQQTIQMIKLLEKDNWWAPINPD